MATLYHWGLWVTCVIDLGTSRHPVGWLWPDDLILSHGICRFQGEFLQWDSPTLFYLVLLSFCLNVNSVGRGRFPFGILKWQQMERPEQDLEPGSLTLAHRKSPNELLLYFQMSNKILSGLIVATFLSKTCPVWTNKLFCMSFGASCHWKLPLTGKPHWPELWEADTTAVWRVAEALLLSLRLLASSLYLCAPRGVEVSVLAWQHHWAPHVPPSPSYDPGLGSAPPVARHKTGPSNVPENSNHPWMGQRTLGAHIHLSRCKGPGWGDTCRLSRRPT